MKCYKLGHMFRYFDAAGATIEREETLALYHLNATTATSVASLVRFHRDGVLAMANDGAAGLEVYKVERGAEDEQKSDQLEGETEKIRVDRSDLVG